MLGLFQIRFDSLSWDFLIVSQFELTHKNIHGSIMIDVVRI